MLVSKVVVLPDRVKARVPTPSCMTPAKVPPPAEVKVAAAAAPLVMVPPVPARALTLLRTLTAWFLPKRSRVPAFTWMPLMAGTVAVGNTGKVLSAPLFRVNVPSFTAVRLPELKKNCGLVNSIAPGPALTKLFPDWR